MNDSPEHLTILKNFLDYYTYKVTTLNTEFIPHHLFNVFHKYNKPFNKSQKVRLYSGSKDYRDGMIHDWTTDVNTADRFADEDGFIVEIGEKGFVRRFNFISMDVLYDYLVTVIQHSDNIKLLQDKYLSESEVYAIELKQH